MSCRLRFISRGWILATAWAGCVALLPAADPAPAAVVRLSNNGMEVARFSDAIVLSEDLDGLAFTATPGGKAERIARGLYRVSYRSPGDVPAMIAALRAEAEKRPSEALTFWQEVLAADRHQWTNERAILGAVRAHLALANADHAAEALRLINQFRQTSPRSPRLAEATDLEAQVKFQRQDKDGALAIWKALAGRGAEWGRDAVVLGARGAAKVLHERKQTAEAVQQLKAALDPSDDAPQQDQLLRELATLQSGMGDDAGALLTWGRLAIHGETLAQADGRLGAANILVKRADDVSQVAAYDEAVLAALLGSGSTVAAAKAVAAAALTALDQRGTLPQDQRKALREGLAKL
jgi:hypothetical protein